MLVTTTIKSTRGAMAKSIGPNGKTLLPTMLPHKLPQTQNQTHTHTHPVRITYVCVWKIHISHDLLLFRAVVLLLVLIFLFFGRRILLLFKF